MFSPEQIRQIRSDARAGRPDAQFLLSQICRHNEDYAGMIDWLERAAESDHADASDALGHCLEKGIGTSRDFEAALQHYRRAIELGSSFAAYHEAELLYKSKRGPTHGEDVRRLLARAAFGDCVPALRALGYLALQYEDGRALAVNCLRRAARLGDAASHFMLGWLLLQGPDGEAREQEAAYCLERARSAQYPLADELLATLNGVQPANSIPAPEQPIEVESAMPLYPATGTAENEVLCEDPYIALHRDVLNIVDRSYLMYLSLPHLRRSDVIDPKTKRAGMVSEVRTSMSTFLNFETVDLISRYLELRIIGQEAQDLRKSEPTSILRYSPGQYYLPHVDYFDPRLPVSKGLLENGGQRTFSAVTYLAAPVQGGGTSFPKLDLTVPAVAGSTLWFRNCLDDGEVDRRSLHAGDSVIRGEKWVATKWFRERPTSYLEF